jgi:hypothetical protein
LLALITLLLKTVLEWKSERDFARAQQSGPEPEPDQGSGENETVILAKSFQ